jgi:hypothetical protein
MYHGCALSASGRRVQERVRFGIKIAAAATTSFHIVQVTFSRLEDSMSSQFGRIFFHDAYVRVPSTGHEHNQNARAIERRNDRSKQ